MTVEQSDKDIQRLKRFAARTQRAVRELEKAEKARQHEGFLKDVADMNANQYDKASRYSNLIIAAGYAAFFAAWSTMGPGGQARMHIAAGLAMMISVIAFIGWEVFKTTYTALHLRRVIVLLYLPGEDVQRNLDRIRQYERDRDLWGARLWYPVLLITIVPGFTAGALLMWMAVVRKFQSLPPTP